MANDDKERGSSGGNTGGFLRDLMTTVEDQDLQNSSKSSKSSLAEASRRTSADQAPVTLALPVIDDIRQSILSPTPADIQHHLPHLPLHRINTAYNNNMASGGQTARERLEKKSTIMMLAQAQDGKLKVPAAGSQSTNDTGSSAVSRASSGTGKQKRNKKMAKRGVGFDRQTDFSRQRSQSMTGGGSPRRGSVGKRRGSRVRTPSVSRDNLLGVFKNEEEQHHQHHRHQHHKHTSQDSATRGHASTKQNLDKSQREGDRSGTHSDERTMESDTVQRSASARSRGRRHRSRKSRRWMGWDTGRLGPHKLRELPDFKDLAPQIGDWIHKFVLNTAGDNSNYNYTPCTPLPLCARESQHYVRDYLATRRVHEMFELMTTALLLRRPDRPLDFLIDFTHVMGVKLKDAEVSTPCPHLSTSFTQRLPFKPPEILPGRPGDLALAIASHEDTRPFFRG